MQDEFAEWECEEIAKRTHDRLLEKCGSGLIVKRKRAAYGYQASDDGPLESTSVFAEVGEKAEAG